MAFAHGRNAYFSLNGTDISAYLDDVGFPDDVDASETTTFGKDAKTFIPGLAGATISLSGKWDPTIEALWNTIKQDPTVAFIYGPTGSTATMRRRTGNCIGVGYDTSNPVGDVITFSMELQVDDGVTYDTF